MFGAFTSFGKLGSLARAIAAAWSPADLTALAAWYDPSDLSTMFNDSAGTTPVATPGTVADSANPVGLIQDKSEGLVLGPELVVNGDFATDTDWTKPGDVSISGGAANFNASGLTLIYQTDSTATNGKYYSVTFTISEYTSGSVFFGFGSGLGAPSGISRTAAGTYTQMLQRQDSNTALGFRTDNFVGKIDNISVKEVPGHHVSQSTSTARPLLSAYDGQTLGPGDTYDATGYPVYLKFDGTDDGIATASFTAGTLINGMDCMIPVRRDSAAKGVLFSVAYASSAYCGHYEAGSSAVGRDGVGTPTVWVDGVQLAGGTAVTAGTLDTALTVGDWHIVEFRGLDLSAFTSFTFGNWFSGFQFNGAQGGILLFESPADQTERDNARAWLAAKVGVTL